MTPFDRGIRWLHDRALVLGGFDKAGQIVGWSNDDNGHHGFLRQPDGYEDADGLPSKALTAESGFWEAGRLLRLLRTPAGFTMATSREEDDS